MEPKLINRVSRILFDNISQYQNNNDKAIKLPKNFENIIDKVVLIRKDIFLSNHCIDKKWKTGLEYQKKRIRKKIDKIQDATIELLNHLNTDNEKLVCPVSFKDIIAEIKSLDHNLSLAYKKGILSIESNAITLEDISLGKFKIELSIKESFESGLDNFLRIHALDPNPASGDSSIIHPHVKDGRLCAGDAYSILKNCLKQGRIEDFFQTVLSILNTYNEESPFRSLDEWEYSCSCQDCGESLEEDNEYCCERCSSSFCESCISSCESCESRYCTGCMSSCNLCESSLCRSCAEDVKCANCRKYVCSGCAETCPKCNYQCCRDCLVECVECCDNLCKDCMKVCTECDDYICSRCVEKCPGNIEHCVYCYDKKLMESKNDARVS